MPVNRLANIGFNIYVKYASIGKSRKHSYALYVVQMERLPDSVTS